jgi:hypothetical protein
MMHELPILRMLLHFVYYQHRTIHTDSPLKMLQWLILFPLRTTAAAEIVCSASSASVRLAHN